MPKLMLRSKQVNVPVQEFTPDKEQDFLRLVAYEASPTLLRIKERAEKLRHKYERLIAL